MKILAVECTASPVSVALAEDGKILGEFFKPKNNPFANIDANG